MKIMLVHNPSAGSGQHTKDLVQLITDAGHEVRHRSTEKGWERLLQDPADLVVAAGGDGTVCKVVLAAADHGLPFAAIPIGTANNIARHSACSETHASLSRPGQLRRDPSSRST